MQERQGVLAGASLDAAEASAVLRFVQLVEASHGPDLHGVWLYGSRARGERPGPESDVDLLVVTRRAGVDDGLSIHRHALDAALAEGANPAVLSVKVISPERLRQRREVEAFFIQEVDRDKIVLAGEP